jgi:hypothetical protein
VVLAAVELMVVEMAQVEMATHHQPHRHKEIMEAQIQVGQAGLLPEVVVLLRPVKI